MWEKCFLECGWREKVLKILNFHDLTAPTRHWFVLPDLGHVVATVYKAALVMLGGRYPTTFLPLSSSVPAELKCLHGPCQDWGRTPRQSLHSGFYEPEPSFFPHLCSLEGLSHGLRSWKGRLCNPSLI
ncbi:hypothetical protein C2S52_022597 [Perilla frutescens var. hirtella]|nr:hypothetical protein C2S52_022597 [Perilla frutescens var. hirtella]